MPAFALTRVNCGSIPNPAAGRGIRRLIRNMAATAFLIVSTAAAAETSMTLTARTSVNRIEYSGGYAIIGEIGSDGSSAPVTTFLPTTLSIAGSDFMPIHYLESDGYLSESWSQSQTYQLVNSAGGAALKASGASKMEQNSEVCTPSGCNLATEQHFSTNTQAFEFTLSGSSSYILAGTTAGGQYVDLFRWDKTTNKWGQLIFGALVNKNTTFTMTGNLGTGLYRITNDPFTIGGGYDRDVDNSWSYTLTLASAVVVAVPEPATWAMLGTGLAVLLAVTRRRRSAAR